MGNQAGMKKKKKPEQKPELHGTAGECMFKDCPMTLAYYVGGKQYVCWLHILVHFPELIPLVKNEAI